MESNKIHWGKAIFWGTLTAALYALTFSNAEIISHMAHTTPSACVVGQSGAAIYYHKAGLDACAAQGGHLVAGTWWHVLLPILLAFAVSYVHGAFTGLFWELMGLKPAAHPSTKH